jgi:hypothetical protein
MLKSHRFLELDSALLVLCAGLLDGLLQLPDEAAPERLRLPFHAHFNTAHSGTVRKKIQRELVT